MQPSPQMGPKGLVAIKLEKNHSKFTPKRASARNCELFWLKIGSNDYNNRFKIYSCDRALDQ